MGPTIPMSKLKTGQKALVRELHIKEGLRRRFCDIGLIKGTKIECVMKSPSGDPVAYKIRGAIIALRLEDTELIFVELI